MMTTPRHIVPGATYFLTRRCSERRYYLLPNKKKLVRAFKYIVAEAAEKFGVQIHHLVMMGNHWHCLFTDPLGLAPEFAARVHRHLARLFNCARGRWDSFWSNDKTSLIRLVDAGAVFAKMVYIAANPTQAGQVVHPRYWPGAVSLPKDLLAEPEVIERPTFFFRRAEDGGRMPATATLRLVKPVCFEHQSDEDFVAELDAALTDRLDEIRKDVRSRGRRFKGADKVRRMKWWTRPKRRAKRRGLNPHLSASDPATRVEAIYARQDFVARYRSALASYRQRPIRKGAVCFPFGTYAMKRRHGVRCEPPPDTS